MIIYLITKLQQPNCKLSKREENLKFKKSMRTKDEIVRMEPKSLHHGLIKALTAAGALMTLIDFTLCNARRFYSSMGNRLAVKGLIQNFNISLKRVKDFNRSITEE